MTKQNNSAIKTGAGLTAVAATAAGLYYFLAGPKAKQHRLQTKAWAKKARAEVAEEIQKLKKVSKPIYEKTVNTVTEKYKQLKNVNPKELNEFATSLKSYWDQLSQKNSKAAGVSKKRGGGAKTKTASKK